METTPGKRVQILREKKGYTSLTSFCEFTGLKVGTISALEKDKSSPSLETLAKLLEAFPDVNLDWLVTGTGNMLKDGRALTPAVAQEPEPPTPGGAAMHVNKEGNLEGYWKAVAEERGKQLQEQQALIERLWNQNDTLLKKPEASFDAAELLALPPRTEMRRWQAVYNTEATVETIEDAMQAAATGGKLIPLYGEGETCDAVAA
jgi:transcriptional regulator with XRE-family HTH domain